MASSPSSQKVDDFLSLLSQLSQDRLREDQRRQRSLQRNIDELRLRSASTSPIKVSRPAKPTHLLSSKYEVPQLTFNRKLTLKEQFLHDLKELDNPPLPERPPVLPRRPDDPEVTPPLPKRPDDGPPFPRRPDDTRQPISIGLRTPVSRKEEPGEYVVKPRTEMAPVTVERLPTKHHTTTSSFLDMERRIRASGVGQTESLSASKSSEDNQLTPSPRYLHTNSVSPTPQQRPQQDAGGTQYKSSHVVQPNTDENTPTSKFKPMKPAKSDWLSSTSQHSTTSQGLYVPKPSYYSAISAAAAAKAPATATPVALAPSTPSRPTSSMTPSSSVRISGTSRSWLDSVVSREDHTYVDTHKRNFSINKAPVLAPEIGETVSSSPSRDKNPNSWLDSVAKKVGTSHAYVDPKPSFKIEKKENTSLDKYKPQPQEDQPDYLLHLAKLKKDSTPVKPPKPQKFNGAIAEEEETLKAQREKIKGKTPPPKPTKMAIESEAEILKQQLGRLSPTKSTNTKPQEEDILKSQLSRLSPTKKTFGHRDYSEQDTELLKSQLNRLGKKQPPKPAKPSVNKYEERDTELLRSQLQRLGHLRSTLAAKEEKIEESPEGLAALSKLKKAKPPPPKVAEKPEALKRLEALRAKEKAGGQSEKTTDSFGATTTPTPDPSDLGPSIQTQLLSILRSSTVPLGAPAPREISRTNTDPTPTKDIKLTHPNKGRARGPKRRLPKAMTNTQSKAPETIKDFKRPPLVNKASKPNLEAVKPSRFVSGELFL